jgi:hypothetical protein
MSCDAVASAAFLWLASFSGGGEPASAGLLLVSAPAASAPAASPLSTEPLFADIIDRASALRAQVQAWKGQTIAPDALTAFQAKLAQLSDLDMQGHVELAKRGTDGDLKCILKGISQDLPVKMKVVAEAKTAPARDAALVDLDYLLRDNVEVITAPPAPEV